MSELIGKRFRARVADEEEDDDYGVVTHPVGSTFVVRRECCVEDSFRILGIVYYEEQMYEVHWEQAIDKNGKSVPAEGMWTVWGEHEIMLQAEPVKESEEVAELVARVSAYHESIPELPPLRTQVRQRRFRFNNRCATHAGQEVIVRDLAVFDAAPPDSEVSIVCRVVGENRDTRYYRYKFEEIFDDPIPAGTETGRVSSRERRFRIVNGSHHLGEICTLVDPAQYDSTTPETRDRSACEPLIGVRFRSDGPEYAFFRSRLQEVVEEPTLELPPLLLRNTERRFRVTSGYWDGKECTIEDLAAYDAADPNTLISINMVQVGRGTHVFKHRIEEIIDPRPEPRQQPALETRRFDVTGGGYAGCIVYVYGTPHYQNDSFEGTAADIPVGCFMVRDQQGRDIIPPTQVSIMKGYLKEIL